jgi:hypothetical protein
LKRRRALLVGFMLTGATSVLNLPGLCDPPAKTILPPTVLPSPPANKAPTARDFGRLPLSFESNQGQTNAKVRFLTHSSDSTLFLTPTEAVFSLAAQRQRKEKSALLRAQKISREATKTSYVNLHMQMVGSDPKAVALQQQPLAGRINYFIGKDPSQWHSGVPTFGRVGFHGVYKGVDLVYYGNQRHLEYDFVVAPHADPKQIILHFAGATGVHLNAAGDLIVSTQGRELQWRKPTVYQQDGAGKHAVAAQFRLKRLPNGQAGVRFALGRYDTDRSLVIDPVLTYSTFLGGSNGESATAIAIDSTGAAYVTGSTASPDFPTTSGAFQPVNHSLGFYPDNAFVTKLNATGTALLYSTYLGGSGGTYGDHATGIAIDSSGAAYVTGYTTSPDFPTTSGAFQSVNKGGRNSSNAFVTKLNATGTALLYSTYLGGSTTFNGDSASGIAVDSGGNAYVAGNAHSPDFPTTPGAFQLVNHSLGFYPDNAFVTKLNATGTALLYSTYLGGRNADAANSIAVDSDGNAYVVGSAQSPDFPVTPDAFQPVNHGRAQIGFDTNTSNAFVTKLNSTGSALLYSTFLGGSGVGDGDSATGIAIDSSGDIYLTGNTNSPDFPTTPGAFRRTANLPALYSTNAFVTKLNSTGTALLYSTYVGGREASGIAIDSSGNAYIIGSAYSSTDDFPTTPGAFQRVNNGQRSFNACVAKLNSTGTALLYATYLGGSGSAAGGDYATGIAVDRSGNAYVAGGALSNDFPITPTAFQRVNYAQSSSNVFVTKLSTIPIFPDFNNDGSTDLLIQNSSTGAIASWFLQGPTWIGGAYFSLTPPSEFALVGTGDFRGDGTTTLVLQSRNTNQIAFWYAGGTNSATISGGDYVNVTPPTGWKVVAVGDFNGDGKSDLVFQNQTSNQIAIWFMNGPTYQVGMSLPFTPLSGWKVVGAGDFNKDGFTDLAFQNQTTGQIALWYMNGTAYVGGTVLASVPSPGWKVVGVGDYNGDGSADLLFQNQNSNKTVVWYLQNGVHVGGDTLSLTPPSGWKIVGPR